MMCKRCKADKTEDLFPEKWKVYISKRTGEKKVYGTNFCTQCTRDRRKETCNKELARLRNKKWQKENRLKSTLYKYDITPEEYMRIYERQGGRCSICGANKPLHLDHNHKTNKVRGLLCIKCNHGLHFIESNEFKIAAEIYLWQHEGEKDYGR